MKNKNWKKKTVEGFNTKHKQKRKDFKKQQNAISGSSITVWNGDVNGALKKLKKVLERADRQKELALKEIKRLKELLDLELISKEEFEEKSKELKEIILGN